METTQNIELAFLDNEEFRLAFGSCYGLLDYHTDIFSHIRAYKPHIWMWLGDAAYTDHIKAGLCKISLTNNEWVVKSDYTMPVEYVKARFQMTLDDPGKKYH